MVVSNKLYLVRLCVQSTGLVAGQLNDFSFLRGILTITSGNSVFSETQVSTFNVCKMLLDLVATRLTFFIHCLTKP